MVKLRGKAIGLPESTCCHTFRAYAGWRTMPGEAGTERPDYPSNKGYSACVYLAARHSLSWITASLGMPAVRRRLDSGRAFPRAT